MAAEYKTTYGQNAVYGSLAYDFNNPELYPEFEYGAVPREQKQERVHNETHTHRRAAVRARSKQGIAPGAVLGMLVAAALFVVAIMAQVQLMDVSAASVELQEQLAELETQQARLKIAYESAFNLNEIETYALAELGMQKPTADQIYYIDTSSPDKAVVVQQSADDSLLDRVADFLSELGSYFK